MIKYNWEIIKKYTKNDPERILDYFSNIYVLKGTMYNYLNSKTWARNIYTNKEEKKSYLLNVDDLIKNTLNGTKDEQYVYLDLASQRDLFTLHNTKGKVNFIPYWKVQHKYTDLDRLRLNRLLEIDENNIHFVYEGEN
jgi:hypothetical protein